MKTRTQPMYTSRSSCPPWLLGFLAVALTTIAINRCVLSAEGDSEFKGPIQIVSLLWDSNNQSAADTLKITMQKAVGRRKIAALAAAVKTLEEKTKRLVAASATEDPRYTVALACQLLLKGSHEDDTSLRQAVESHLAKQTDRDSAAMLLEIWFSSDSEAFQAFFRENISKADPELASALLSVGISKDRVATAESLLANWEQLPEATRILAIEPLTAAEETMKMLVSAVQKGRLAKDLINTNQLRKWLPSDSNDLPASKLKLKQAIESVWGRIRSADDAERQAVVRKMLELLTSGKSGSVANGNKVFKRVCSQCHVLHNEGYEVGPNIAGNGRGSLQQLTSNIFDPSLVIGEAFQAKTVLTADGEIVSGLVVAENDRYLQLKLQGGKIEEFDKKLDIEQIKASTKSLMPEGLEEQMTEQETLDLFAYLCLLKPLGSENNELIPGTPEHLVQP